MLGNYILFRLSRDTILFRNMSQVLRIQHCPLAKLATAASKLVSHGIMVTYADKLQR